MSIDFSTLQGLSIPEGVVKKITDEAGWVLWEGVKKVTITLTGLFSQYSSYNANVVYNGTTYYTPNTSFEAAVGDELTLSISLGISKSIWLNGVQVVSDTTSTATYKYTVVGDTTINVSTTGSGSSTRGKMEITET